MSDPEQPRSRRAAALGWLPWLWLLPWLCLPVVVLLVLFGVGQLALLDLGSRAVPALRSQLRADYRAWAVEVFGALDPEIIREALRDEGAPGQQEVLVIPGEVWLTPGPSAGLTPVAPSTPTSTARAPGITVVVVVSATPADTETRPPTVEASSATPTLEAQTSTPTRTGLPTTTSTFLPTVTTTGTPTPTSTPPPPPPPASPTPTLAAPTVTATPSLPPAATDTPTFTPTPTETLGPGLITGRVFEDRNYVGGPGAAFGAGDAGVPNVRVELYTGVGALLGFVSTDAAGMYTLNVPSGGAYIVRVVSASLGDGDSPPAGGLNFAANVIAEQTFESDGVAGNGGAGALGGNNAAVSDLATAPGVGVGDTHVAVNVGGASVTGVDFGFAYNLIVNTADTGQGSLRQFLLNAAAMAGPNAGQFSIPVTDPGFNTPYTNAFTILPGSALPALTDGGTSVDGATQEANRGDLRFGLPDIVIDGLLAGSNVNGLLVQSNGNTLRKLDIRRFNQGGGVGILIDGGAGDGDRGDDNVLAQNYLTSNSNTTGTLGALRLTGQANRNTIIGNTLVANNSDGLEFAPGSEASFGNTISGNVLTGQGEDGAVLRGVGLTFSNNQVTVNGPVNGSACGVEVAGLTNSTLAGNTISENGPVGGLCFMSAVSSGNTVGPNNTITLNTGPGLVIATGGSQGNRFTQNAIFANGGLGIDLGNDGVTSNDPGDGDAGVNGLLNFPVLYTATLDGLGNVVITGEARPNVVVEFFVAAPDGSGFGEGQTYLGAATVTSGVPGTQDGTAWQFTVALPAGALASGGQVTATATDLSLNTSEFAQNVVVP